MCDEISLQKTLNVSVVAAGAEEISGTMMLSSVLVISIVLTTANRLHYTWQKIALESDLFPIARICYFTVWNIFIKLMRIVRIVLEKFHALV